MGKSPGKWIKTVLFGKKSSKTSYRKGRENAGNAKEVLIAVKASEADVDVAPAIPVSSQLDPYANEGDERKLEQENEESANIPNDDEISLPVSQDIDSQKSTIQDSDYDPERMKQKQAATIVQAAFKGYLARRAFVALKGIIRLQALIRGHLVRRQAITTLCCMMGIVKLQAHARGVMARRSDGGLEVRKICNQMNLRESKPVVSLGVNMPSRIGKLSANAFVHKLVASSLPLMPLRLLDDAGDPNSVWNWLERWSAYCFWKPVPQLKKASDTKMRKKHANAHVETGTSRPKLSVRQIRSTNLDGTSVQATSELDKPKRNPRKVSIHPAESSVEENPQNVLEKVKRNLRKVHNPVVESSVQSEVEFDKPKQSLEVSSATNLDIAEQSLNTLSEKTDKETALTVNSSAEKMKNEMAITVNSSTEEMRRETIARNSSAEKMNKETALKINSSAEKTNKEKASKLNNSVQKMRQEIDTANGSAEKMKKESALTVNSLAEKLKKETALPTNNSVEKMNKEKASKINNSVEKMRQETDTANGSPEKMKKESALTVNSLTGKLKKETALPINNSAEKMKKETVMTVNSSAEKMRQEADTVNSSTEKVKKETTLTVNSSVEKVKKEFTPTVNGSAEKMKYEMTVVNKSAEKMKQEAASTVNISTEKVKKETTFTVNSSAEKVKKETVATVNESAEKMKNETTVTVSKSPDIETMPEPFGMETSDLFHADPSVFDSKPSIDRTVKDDNISKANGELNRKDDSMNNENQKSGRKASSPAVPSYMAATESAKAKLRLQGSPQSTEDGADKINLTRRQSLPFSANSKISSQSPRTQRLVHSGKEGSKSDRSLSSREKRAKAAQVEWKR